MACSGAPAPGSSPTGMGNTSIGTVHAKVHSNPFLLLNSNSGSAPVHNVQVAAKSCFSSFAPTTEQKQTNVSAVFPSREHKSDEPPRDSDFPASPAQPNEMWGDMEEEDGEMLDHAPSPSPPSPSQSKALAPEPSSSTTPSPPTAPSHIPTPHQPIQMINQNFPPFPPRHALDDDPLQSEIDPSKGNILRVFADLKTVRGQRLPPSISNNRAMFYNLVFKAALAQKVEFSSRTIIPGLLQHQIGVDLISNARREEMRAHQLKKIEAQAEMSEAKITDPKTISIFSHIFTLKFDSTDNKNSAFNYLRSIKLKTFFPPDPVIRGKVHGIPYHIYESNPERVTAYLERYFWYKGGAPSFTITWHKYKALGRELVEEVPYFSVVTSEFQYCKQVPQLTNPRYKLQLEKFHPSKTKVCNHCWHTGHSYKTCPDKQTRNKQAAHLGACPMCASFEHTMSSCPAMNDPHAQCILCHGTHGKGKHTARFCPIYTGTYEKTWINTHAPVSVWRNQETAVLGHLNPVVPTSTPPQHPHNHNQQQQQQSHYEINSSNHSAREIKGLKDTIAQLKKVIRDQVSKQQQYDTIIQEMRKDRQEMKDMFTKLVTMMTHSHTNAASKNVQVIPYDAPSTPVMSGTRSHISALPSAVGNRSRGNSLVNLANQSLITNTIKPVTQTTPQTTISTHNAFTALMHQKSQNKPTTTAPQSTISTDDEKEDVNACDDDDVDEIMSTDTPTPKKASSFSLGKKHTRTSGTSPKKPKKKTKAHSTK
jgi:hypothetical protein